MDNLKHGADAKSMISTFRLQFQVSRCVGKKDYEGAIECCRKILDRDSQDAFAQTMVAQCFEWMGRSSDALDAARIVLNRDPTDPFCLRIAGRSSAELGQHDEASRYVEQSLIYPVQYSGSPTRGLDLLSTFLRVASFIPLLRRTHQRLRRERAEIAQYDDEWNDWAQRYLEWYRSTFDGKR
jgi:tetratricopeptide (TPR) repeat protein